MSVPEASVNEDHGLMAFENDVGLSRQGTIMKSEAEPGPVEKRAKRDFGPGIPPRYSRHVPAAPFWTEGIGHQAFTRTRSRTSAMISAI